MDLRSVSVRKFKKGDSVAVSNIIRDNLKKLNIADYPEEIINYMYELFTPEYVFSISNRRKMYVAMDGNVVAGTATIDYDIIHTVFVDDKYKSRGIEKKLLELLEEIISNNGLKLAKVHSTITARKIYEKLGYNVVEEIETEKFGKEIVMERYLV